MKKLLLLALAAAFPFASAQAAELKARIEIPQLDVAEYHRPYVAVWIEREDASVAANLAVWYQQPRTRGAQGGEAGESGTKWLPDLRQWWRRSGRSLTLPVDGVTGATRPAGVHELAFDDSKAPLKDLAAGSYRLVVEAAREVGGRELLKVPFQWPPSETTSGNVQGESELGTVALELIP
jgi:hypothetical protein